MIRKTPGSPTGGTSQRRSPPISRASRAVSDGRSAALDRAYHVLEAAVGLRVAQANVALFTTDVHEDDLWAAYLSGYPKKERPFYACTNCRRFIQTYGGLVTLTESGYPVPYLWTDLDVPAIIQPVVDGLHSIASSDVVSGVFRWPEAPWGVAQNRSDAGALWTHLHGTPPIHHTAILSSPAQQMAQLTEDFGMLTRALADYRMPVAEEAVRVLLSGALTRSEKAEGVATWFLALHRALAVAPKKQRGNVLWSWVASAPPGFPHIRTTIISTLLDDILAKQPFDEVARKWAEKLHPKQYQRPSAAPSAGQIAAAEKIVEKLDIERSLARRYATLADVLRFEWRPRREPNAPATGGVFDKLQPQKRASVKALDLPAQRVTLAVLARDFLPEAYKIEAKVPKHGNFYGLLTAIYPDAPPILQWDGLDGRARNAASPYVYVDGSPCTMWGLVPGWLTVTGVFRGPHEWQEPDRFTHHAPQLCFALEGARDAHNRTLCLFPEILRTELHAVRRTIEAFSEKTRALGVADGDANGLAFAGNSPVELRLHTASGTQDVILDRWE